MVFIKYNNRRKQPKKELSEEEILNLVETGVLSAGMVDPLIRKRIKKLTTFHR